jgi:drug/metabolite transporter (DMT)-like permease
MPQLMPERRSQEPRVSARTAVLTAVTMVGFAANSILCRLALGARTIDAASFAALRLGSGALMLFAIARAMHRDGGGGERGSWLSATMLFAYALPFSLAYLSLSAGTGALILFGMVQATMVLAGLSGGERPRVLEWLGLAAALAGLVYLVSPGLEAPSASGSTLMAGAGVAWGIYSLRGRGVRDPVRVTADNFARSVPMVLAAAALSAALAGAHVSARGALLAVVSGAVTSSLIYVVWYAAVRGLTATRAATVQLSVPALAALGGVAFLAEPLTPRLILSAALILGGVGVALAVRARAVSSHAG